VVPYATYPPLNPTRPLALKLSNVPIRSQPSLAGSGDGDDVGEFVAVADGAVTRLGTGAVTRLGTGVSPDGRGVT
jgi:hypothetical protein